jgi:hypothetical protein
MICPLDRKRVGLRLDQKQRRGVSRLTKIVESEKSDSKDKGGTRNRSLFIRVRFQWCIERASFQ